MQGNLVAGGIANLSTDGKEIIIVDGEKVYFINYDEVSGNLEEFSFTRDDSDSTDSLRLGYLKRRISSIENRFEGKISYIWNNNELNSFGPWAITRMLRREQGGIDAMIDPIEGQKWYEACIWAAISEKFLDVRNLTQPAKKYGDYVLESFSKRDDWDGGIGYKPRIQLLIAANPKVNEKMLEVLRKK